jgi:hypothetical protein
MHMRMQIRTLSACVMSVQESMGVTRTRGEQGSLSSIQAQRVSAPSAIRTGATSNPVLLDLGGEGD